MAYTLRQLPDEPIIIDTHVDPIDPATYPAFARDLVALATSIDGPFFRIIDLSDVQLSFTVLVTAMAEETRSGLPGTTGDPRVRSLLVGSGEGIDLILASAKQAQYGGVQLIAFATLDEAIAYARAQIEAQVPED